MEAKQKISDMETYLNELGQQLQMAQQEKMKLEQILNHSGTTIPDDAKTGIKNFTFSPPPGLASFMNGGGSKMPPPPPPPPLNGGPPPPPPPGFPSSLMQPPKPIIKKDVPPSSVPLKCFNWTKIPDAKVSGTIWTELDEAKLYKVLDLGEFDRLFSAYQKNGLNHVNKALFFTNCVVSFIPISTISSSTKNPQKICASPPLLANPSNVHFLSSMAVALKIVRFCSPN